MHDEPDARAEAIRSTPAHDHVTQAACGSSCPSYGQLGRYPAEPYRSQEEQRAADMPRMGLLLSHITLAAIQAEATGAHAKHKQFSMLYGSNDRRFRIMMEEAAEVARELNDAEIYDRPVDKDKLVAELIQVAAMAATWIEALEGDHDPGYRSVQRKPDPHAQDVDGPAVEVNVSPGPSCTT